MEKSTAQHLVSQTFKAAFDRERFRNFVNELTNGFNETKKQTMQIADAFKTSTKTTKWSGLSCCTFHVVRRNSISKNCNTRRPDTEDFEGPLPKIFADALGFIMRNLHSWILSRLPCQPPDRTALRFDFMVQKGSRVAV